jgi:hypothetical protein
MKDVSSEAKVKAAVGALIAYAATMGPIGVYWAVQCGSHWFTYTVISLLPYAAPGAILVYVLLIWVQSDYAIGPVRFWLVAGGLSLLVFVGCFVFAHLQPAMPLNVNDCEPL